MSATTRTPGARSLDTNGQADTGHRDVTDHGRRLTTETKSAFKTTEFIAYLAVLAGILIAGLMTNSSKSPNGVNHPEAFGAHLVWLYATILTVGYMISRGLSKAGSRQPYDEKS